MSNKIHRVQEGIYLKKVPTGKSDICTGCYYEPVEKDCFKIWNKLGCDKHIFKKSTKEEYQRQLEEDKDNA